MTPLERMQRIDALLSHVWMVRTFLKHAPEAEEDEELREVHRDLYDFMLALGKPLQQQDPQAYLDMARRKWRRLERAVELFLAIQPDVSTHMNFQMAALSLRTAVEDVRMLVFASEE